MLKQGYHNLVQPRFLINSCTKSCVYFSENRALPQVLICRKGNVTFKAMTKTRQDENEL